MQVLTDAARVTATKAFFLRNLKSAIFALPPIVPSAADPSSNSFISSFTLPATLAAFATK